MGRVLKSTLSLAVVVWALPCFAKTPTFTGKMVAYDPLLHAAKNASRLSNREEIVLETPGHKEKYVKLIFLGVGDTQIDPKYFDGTTPLSVRALRDTTCDEPSPSFVTEVTVFGYVSAHPRLQERFPQSQKARML
jgi:hypothetical protein